MRRIVLTALMAIGVAVGLAGMADVSFARQDLVVGGAATVSGTDGRGLRVRSGPGLSYRSLGVLPEGTIVQILAAPVSDGQDDWYQVSSGSSVTGWSLERYLSPNDGAQSRDGGQSAPAGNQLGSLLIGPSTTLTLSQLDASAPADGGRTFVAKVTAYANGVSGVATDARTATGSPTRPGVVAVDPRVIPLHSVIVIEGFPHPFIAEDVGGAVRGTTVDVWLPDPVAARRFGTQYRSVRVVREGPGSAGVAAR